MTPSTAPPASTTRGRARYLIHGVDLVVESDLAAASDAVAMSYGAFVVHEAVEEPSDVLRISARTDGRRSWLTDHGGRSTLVMTESEIVLGLLDRVVAAVLDRLGARGILGTHAGVVEVAGRAVLLAGRSGSGKSTLTLGLLRRGAALLTDELALIESDNRTILPYPRALHVSPETVELLPQLSFLHGRPRHDLGGGSEWSVTLPDVAAAFETRLAGPTPLALVVLLDGDPDPTRGPELRPVSPALATMELLRGTPSAAADFEGTMRRMTTIVADVPCVRLRGGELDRAAVTVLDRLADVP